MYSPYGLPAKSSAACNTISSQPCPCFVKVLANRNPRVLIMTKVVAKKHEFYLKSTTTTLLHVSTIPGINISGLHAFHYNTERR